MGKRAETVKVPVTTRALIQRINRKLEKQDECLRATRGEQDRPTLGDYFVVDVSMNAVVSTDVDPETLGRELGVLRAWEHVVEGER